MKYYHMFWRDEGEGGVAYADESVDIIDTANLLEEGKLVANWTPLYFKLREGLATDYQSNDLALRLCSRRMKEILQRELGVGERIQWLEVQVDDTPYFVMHLPDTPDVLHKGKSVYAAGDQLMVPFLNRRLLGTQRVFKYEMGSVHDIVVADQVRIALIVGQCSGIEFSEVPQA